MAGIWQMGAVISTNVWELGSVGAYNTMNAPATAFPGQSRTLTGAGFEAVQGTGGVTIGGVAQTITNWSDTSVTFTTVLGTNSYGTNKTVELTTNSATTFQTQIELVADTAGGFGAVTMSSPNTTDESSVAFNTTPAVVTGDQFEWEDFNALGNLVVNAQGFVENVDTEGVFRGRFWDDTDDTWGSVENFTAEVPASAAPVVTSVDVPAASTFIIEGGDMNFTVNWDQNVIVTGTPQLLVTIGATQVAANYISGTGTTALLFSYSVVEGDEDTDGITVDSLSLNGGTLKNNFGDNADLTLNNIGDTSSVFVDGVRPVLTITDLTTTDTTPIVSGTCDDATSLTLVVDGVTYNPVPSGGTWSQQLNELT